jgi:hypothetical protein
METDYTIGKTYLIKDIEGIYVTATILYEDEQRIKYTDRDGKEGGLLKKDILKWKEVLQ